MAVPATMPNAWIAAGPISGVWHLLSRSDIRIADDLRLETRWTTHAPCGTRIHPCTAMLDIENVPVAQPLCTTCMATAGHWSSAQAIADASTCGCGSTCIARGPSRVPPGVRPIFVIRCLRCGRIVGRFAPSERNRNGPGEDS